uniref:Uncharacterized protein n=1 Tax=Acrobeloides nanus TaxID=290746 RepID=A0A914DWH8_9BILA
MRKLFSGLKQIFLDFCHWSSTDAIPHIATGFFYQFIFQLLHTYFQYPTNVDTTITYGTKVFPAVTYCLFNPWKLSQIAGTPLQDLVNAYISGNNEPGFGFTSPSTTVRQQRAQKWTQLMYETLQASDEATNQNMSYGYSDLFIQCTYNTYACEESDFQSFYDPFYGQCFTFNYNGKYNTSRASPNYGLQVIIRVFEQEFLPWITSSGVSVSIKKQGKTPFADSKGYFAPSGKDTAFGIRSITKIKLPKPYSNCEDTMSKKNKYDTETCIRNCIQAKIVSKCGCYDPTYNKPSLQTTETCIRNCIQAKIVSKCGCYDPTYNKPSSQTVLSCFNMADPNTAIDCILSIEDTDGTSGFNVNTECNCPQVCNDESYKIAVSNAIWPAQKYKPTECIQDVFAPANTSNPYNFWNQPPVEIPTSAPETSCNNTNNNNNNHDWRWWIKKSSASPCTTPATTTTPKPTTTTKASLQSQIANIGVTIGPCKNWYDGNTLMSEVYFEEMNFLTNEESPAYPALNLISDIGGQLGFWLGMSILSVIEFLILFGMWILFLLCYAFGVNIFKDNKTNNDPNANNLYHENNFDLPPKVQDPTY